MQYFLIIAALSFVLMIAFCSPSRSEPEEEKKVFFIKLPSFSSENNEDYNMGGPLLKIKKFPLKFAKNKMAYRELIDIDTLIIHHTAISEDVSAEAIDAEHKRIGWACIGYHYLIHEDGQIEKCRLNTMIGAHCQGFNSTSIGIALGGNFEKAKPTEKQIEALEHLVTALRLAYPQIKRVRGHCYFLATACPGCELDKICQERNIYK